MPDKSQTPPEPVLEMEIVGELGDTSDPVYNGLIRVIVDTIRDVHLIHARDGRMSTAQLERGGERMVFAFIHDLEVIEGDFDDAMTALLNQRAPLTTWRISYDHQRMGVVIQGFYLRDMPAESITYPH